VLDLVNPVGAGRGLVGGGWQARLYEGGSTQHSAYLGGPQKRVEVESCRERNTARRIGVTPRQARAPPDAESTNPAQPPLWRGFPLSGAMPAVTQGSPWKRQKRKGPRGTSKPGALTLPRVFECTGTRVVSNDASASAIGASCRHACRSTGEPFGPLDGVHALGFLPGLI
jgi:hypothetical protein